MIKIKTSIPAITVAVLVIAAGSWYMGSILSGGVSRSFDCPDQYSWINKRLTCGDNFVINKAEYGPAKAELLELVAEAQAEGRVDVVAVYFRDLESGPTFGINEKEAFIPASLLKVPVMLTYFRLAEEDPEILGRKIVYRGRADEVRQNILPKETIEIGVPYVVDNLIFRMIAYSDNRSLYALRDHLFDAYGDDLVVETYKNLGIVNPGEDVNSNILTAKSYASIFRALYNSSYLSNSLSEKALQYLSEVRYSDGLVGGIPDNVPVAHKFGERTSSSGLQLHDCGIVYYPGNPYLLCVMTRGKNLSSLAGFIQEVSELVYKEVDSRKIK